MHEIVKEIILNFQESDLETGVPRRIAITALSKKASVCIGVRRCGKSTMMNQIIQKLLEKGISRKNILYINFFDDRLYGLTKSGLNVITEAYYSLYPEKKSSETIYCFFDEIQMIDEWEPFIDRLMRTEKCQVYITGSSAKMLSKEIATQMRGRALSWEMFPFSFREYLDFRNIQSTGSLSSKKRLTIQKAFEDYWQCGGFPEVFDIDKSLRVKIHQEYLHATLFRDLIERYDISHPRAVVDLAHHLLNNIASLYSINSLTGMLKSLGHSAPKNAISSYIDGFEDAFFLFSVRRYDASLSRSKRNPKKVYAIDHSLVKSVSSGILLNTGHLLENLVFVGWRRVTSEIYYYKTASCKEVDFIAICQDGSKMLVQVSETIAEAHTRDREISALTEAMSELSIQSGIIVTRNESETISVEEGEIRVVPAWSFLLELDNTE